MTRFPLLTALLTLMACGLALSPGELQNELQFSYPVIASGNWTGLLTGHWLHADLGHLAWNLGAFAVIAGFIERHSRRLLISGTLVGMAGVDLLLLSPWSNLERYCGLSGMLNTLMGVMIYLLWRRTRSPIVLLVGILAVAKIAVEMRLGQSVFTDISWPPYAAAHLAGILATPIALLLGYRGALEHTIKS